MNVLLLVLSILMAIDPVADSRKLQQEAMQAYRAKDYATFLTRIRAASDLRPQHPTLLYYVAAGLALSGREDESLRILERLADMGMVYAPEKEADFANVSTAAVAQRFQKNAAAIGQASVASKIAEHGLIPEGLAYDGKRVLVGSVRKGAIYANGKPWVTDLPYGVFGLAIDKDVLWAAASSVPEFERHREDGAAVLKIDRRSGKVLRTIAAPAGKHIFGDLTVAANGDVYVSDSGTPAIYRIHDDDLEPLIEGAPFVSLQGLAARGNTLYVADYSKGVYAVDLTTHDATLLRVPEDITLLGVDGLYIASGGLIATQNGVNPHRVIRIRLDGLDVKGVETLAANLPGMDEPTLGAIHGGAFYFNANSQWEKKERNQDAVVLKVNLSR